MKQKAIIILLSVLVVVQFLASFWKQEPENTYYIDKYKEHQEQINNLYEDLTRQKNQINEIKNEISKTDSIIDSSSKDELREITGHYLRRIK